MNHIKRFSPSILALALLGPLNASANGEQCVAADTVMASFQRMLDHESSHFAPRVPPDAGEDPLQMAVNMVLWQSRPASLHVANDRCHAAISHARPTESTQTYRKDETCRI